MRRELIYLQTLPLCDQISPKNAVSNESKQDACESLEGSLAVALATKSLICPATVGSDIGCGMIAV